MNFFIDNEPSRVFFLPLSAQASEQYDSLLRIIMDSAENLEAHDSWSYTWGSSYSSKKAYKSLQGTVEASPLFLWVWKSGNLGKHKFFIWLLIKDRLNTMEDYSCVLCNSNSEETSFHLFFKCPFSLAYWNSIGIQWDLSLQPLDMIIQARLNFGSHIFREILISAC